MKIASPASLARATALLFPQRVSRSSAFGFILRLGLVLLFATAAGSIAADRSGPDLPLSGEIPAWPKPAVHELPPGAPSVRSGDLKLTHSPDQPGGYILEVAGDRFAVGQGHWVISYVKDATLRWCDLSAAADKRLNVFVERGTMIADFEAVDLDGARWHIRQQFAPRPQIGAIDIQTEVSVDQERAVAFLPLLLLFPGAGTFGTAKHQGLFAGLEYLENEPSSSEADVVGPSSKRQIPNSLKLTFPLMGIQEKGRYLALTWRMRPQFCALFDSPDRVFASGGHVMGLLFPGSDGKSRVEGSLLPKSAQVLGAHRPITLDATLIGGQGDSIVPAIEQYVRLHGLPPLPSQTVEIQQYVKQAAGGWLDSKIREGSLVRHAIAGGNFPPGQAADAGVWMEWLACQTQDPALSARLKTVSQDVLKVVPAEQLNFAGVGHIRYPLPALLYGNVAANAAKAQENGRRALQRFQPDGAVIYQPAAGGADYGKTHFSKEASGLASATVVELMESAAFCGDPELCAAAIRQLKAMDKFRFGVPRGAQTWECPLHTPDILASAQMVRAYTLGFEMTGDSALLDQARYWAWTGVPFVYLVNPTERPVGLYSTIAVFGATQWQAPVWLGLPVQWCGLVYAESLYRLVRHDPGGPWKKLADGITLSGIQQSWPAGEPEFQGLLPDSFVLRDQHRNGPAINPATLEACAVRYFSATPVYDFWCSTGIGLRVHAPGGIKNPKETGQQVAFQIVPWREGSYYALINGLKRKPKLTINGKATDCSAPHEFFSQEGRLVLQLTGSPQIELIP